MEILRSIYPTTLYILYGTSFIAFIAMLVLLIKVSGALKACRLTLEPVDSIKNQVTEIQNKSDYITTYIKDKNSQFKQFLKKYGLFLTVWHILFPKKDKRRR